MNTESLFKKCIAGKRKNAITGNIVFSYNVSPYIVYCEFFAPHNEKDKISEFQKLLFEQGKEHELNVYDKMFDGVRPIVYETEEEGFLFALDEFFKGAKIISNSPLFYFAEGLKGRPDLLEKRKGGSVFGNHHYVVYEIKSAKNIKKKHVMQACFYNYVIGKIQGYIPEHFYLINREMKEYKYSYGEYKDELLKQITEIKEIINGKKISPIYNVEWPWSEYSKKKAIESNDVTLVSGIGEIAKAKLANAGIKTVNGLLKSSRIKGISEGSLQKWKLSAKALSSGKHIVISKPRFPSAKTEIFFDFEGAPDIGNGDEIIGIDYLIGCLVNVHGKEKYIPFVARNTAEEEKMFKNFVKFISSKKDYVLYHYASYETTHLKKLAVKYNVNVDEILKHMVDLLSVVRASVVFPTHSNSIKEVAPYIGFRWRQENFKGDDSIALYLEYLKDKNKSKLAKIINYNEDDVRATLALKKWLERISVVE